MRTGVVAAAGLAAGYAVLWALTGYGLGWVTALSNTTRLIIESTSVSTGLGLVAGKALKLAGEPQVGRHAVSAMRALGLLVLAVVLTVLWLWARRQAAAGRVLIAAGAALVAAVVLAPVVFPWYLLVAVAVLGYAPLADRWRFRLALLLAPVGLLVLPNGNGLAALFRGPIAVLDVLLLAVATAVGVRWLVRHRRAAPAPGRRR